jgi:hypothetical protein
MTRSAVASACADGIVLLLVVAASSAAPPVLETFAINNGAATTNSRIVTLNSTWSGFAPTYFRAGEDPEFNGSPPGCPLAADCSLRSGCLACYARYEGALRFVLCSEENGEKTVYFQVYNSDGESLTLSDTIILNEEPSVWISGNVLDYIYSEVAGVQILGVPGNVETDSCGYYVARVPLGWTGTVTPSRWSQVYSPPSRSYSNLRSD